MLKNIFLISSFPILSSLTFCMEMPRIMQIERCQNVFNQLMSELQRDHVVHPQRAAFTGMVWYVWSFMPRGASWLVNNCLSCLIVLYPDASLFVMSKSFLSIDLIHDPGCLIRSV
jgi:hypothetical protein